MNTPNVLTHIIQVVYYTELIFPFETHCPVSIFTKILFLRQTGKIFRGVFGHNVVIKWT